MRIVRVFAAIAALLVVVSAFGQSTPFPPSSTDAQDSVTLEYQAGWNYKGNSFGFFLNLEEEFGAFYEGTVAKPGVTENVNSVWAWDPYRQKWGFWAPYFSPEYLSQYARQNGWCPLVGIQTGRGYWMRTTKKFSVIQQQYYDPSFILGNMANGSIVHGWNSIALPMAVTARELASLASQTPPTPGKIGAGVASIWTWSGGDWGFYAPVLDEQGGKAAVTEYALQHGLVPLDEVGVGQGVWVDSADGAQIFGDFGECEGDNDGGKG